MFTKNYNITQNLCAMKGTSKLDSIEDAVTNFNLRRMKKASWRRWLLSRSLKGELISVGQGVQERYSRMREQPMRYLRGVEELLGFILLGGGRMVTEEPGKEAGALRMTAQHSWAFSTCSQPSFHSALNLVSHFPPHFCWWAYSEYSDYASFPSLSLSSHELHWCFCLFLLLEALGNSLS